MTAFQEFVMLSAESANEKWVCHPVTGAFPLSVTVNWTWYPPAHELTTDEVRVQPPAGGVLPVGLGDGLGETLGDGLGEGEEPPLLLV